MGEKIIFVGGGSHALVVADAADLVERCPIGYVDPSPTALSKHLPYLGDDSALFELIAPRGACLPFVAIGAVSKVSLELRAKVCDEILKGKSIAEAIIHPAASISKSAKIGRGVFVGPMAVIGPHAIVEDHVIVNSSAIIEHDCVVSRLTHVASGACLAGGVVVGSNSLIGAKSIVKQGVEVGSGVVIGAGSAVMKNIANNLTVVGVPAIPRV